MLNDDITLRYRKYPTNFNLSTSPNYLPTMWVGITCKMFKKSENYIPNYGLKANEDLSYVYYYLATKEKIACSNKSVYTRLFAPNSLARNFILENLNHIDNTIKPLEYEYALFKENTLLTKYYQELEAVFIKNIMERIVNIKQSKKSKATKDRLIGIIIAYLTSRFPDWRQNKYLKNRFIGFPFDSFFYLNVALPSLSEPKRYLAKTV